MEAEIRHIQQFLQKMKFFKKKRMIEKIDLEFVVLKKLFIFENLEKNLNLGKIHH